MTLLDSAGRSLAAARNLASYPIRYRRLGRSWRDGWTALMLRVAASGPGKAVFKARERSLRLRGLPVPLTLRQTNSDIFVVRDVFESEDYGLVRTLGLPDDATIVDLGANIGLASLYFAGLFPRSTILAVEPDADNCDLVRRNCAPLIEAGRMDVVRAFVAAADGAAAIDRSDQSWGYRKADDAPAGGAATGSESIRCLSMATLLARRVTGTIDLLKCDVEGSEAELFADCAGWIDRVRHLVIEVHPPYSPERLYDDLRRAGWAFEECDRQRHGAAFWLCVLKHKA